MSIALEHYLKPFTPFLQLEGVTEICINRPQEIYVERAGHFARYEVSELTLDYLETLAELVAEFNSQEISPEKPLLSASLPQGERIQFVRSPACEIGKLICSIRRPHLRDLTLEDYVTSGAFKDLKKKSAQDKSLDEELYDLYKQEKWFEFLQQAILKNKNILISGGTGTGKTTFLNACLKMIPASERLITIEDTREVLVQQPNVAHLLVSRGEQGVAKVTMQQLFEGCLRLRPDRIFLSELRGKEAFAFLRAANSGHPGSLSTIHADSPKAAFNQLIFMMQQAGSTSNDERLLAYIQSIVPIVVQLKRCASGGRFMIISEVYYAEHDLRERYVL